MPEQIQQCVSSDDESQVTAQRANGPEADDLFRGKPGSSQVIPVIRALTGDEKRSLASKYLHFHRLELFFIYDSRAAQSIARFSKGFKRSARRCPAGVDATYGAFVVRALEVHDCIFDNHGKRLMPRQLDRVLLQIAALS